jgi:hypothetical protein
MNAAASCIRRVASCAASAALALAVAWPAAATGATPADGAAATPGAAAASGGLPVTSGTSSQQNPVVEFLTPGLHTVTLTACNAAGCTTASHFVTVANPMPVVGALAVAPALAYVGQLIFLEGSATGQPTLGYVWEVLQGGNSMQTLTGASAVWNTAGFAMGAYTLQLTAQNASGSNAASLPVVLLAPVADAFFTLAPCRIIDTRSATPSLLSGAAPRVITVAGTCGVPVAARAVALNITAVAPTMVGNLAVYPADYPQGLTNSVSFSAGVTQASFSVLPLSTDGNGQLAATAGMAAGGQVDLLIDVAGYFAPAISVTATKQNAPAAPPSPGR